MRGRHIKKKVGLMACICKITRETDPPRPTRAVERYRVFPHTGVALARFRILFSLSKGD
jgi:hypothetical protein